MENKKKRVVAQSIENKKGKTFSDYADEFEYLISAGIALNVQAISNLSFPLIESSGKNLLKLYLNDVGILTGILYGNNIRAVLDDERSINLGSVYETVVACELIAHGHKLFYYDNRSKGEVDYLLDDYDSLSVVAHAAENCKQLFCFLRSKHRGRLIENKYVCTAVQHLDYFNSLLFRN